MKLGRMKFCYWTRKIKNGDIIFIILDRLESDIEKRFAANNIFFRKYDF